MMCQYGCSTGSHVDSHQHLVTMDAQLENLLMQSDCVKYCHYKWTVNVIVYC